MQDRIFIDTNIFVYGFLLNDKIKHQQAFKLLDSNKNSEIFISIQVVNEIYSSLAKNKIDTNLIKDYIFQIANQVNIGAISFETIKKCLYLKETYKYSYWDSLILASALENTCYTLYSEDMQSGQIIENSLKILNPFQ